MVFDGASKYPIQQAVKHALIAFMAATAKARRCDEGSSKRGIAAAKADLAPSCGKSTSLRKRAMRLFRGVGLLIALVFATAQSAQALDTFPGASGAGRATSGGRGGAVFIVANTADSGTGSLRACMQSTGARTCVFRTSGTIQLATSIIVTSGALTVAGQTSPGGIQIRLKSGIAATAAKTPIRILASNVFLRHLRVRPGNEAAWDSTRGMRSGIGIAKWGTVRIRRTSSSITCRSDMGPTKRWLRFRAVRTSRSHTACSPTRFHRQITITALSSARISTRETAAGPLSGATSSARIGGAIRP